MCFRISGFCRLLHSRCESEDMESFTGLLIFLVLVVFASADEVKEPVNLKPGKEMVYEKTLRDFMCRFEYQVQGGTNEDWEATIDITQDGVTCIVERGRASYLFFQKFALSLTGPGLAIQDIEVIDTGSTLVDRSAYKLDSETNTVSHVEGVFRNHLERVAVRGVVQQKHEL